MYCSKIDELFTIDETDPNSARIKNNFLGMVILSEPIESWQIVSLDAYADTPIFNFFSDHYVKVKKLFKKHYSIYIFI
jgi:hypothetical protein